MIFDFLGLRLDFVSSVTQNEPQMKNIFILGGLLCLFASCSKYQYGTLNSTNAVKNEQSGDFIVENYTLAIVYRFKGENAPLNIQIKNKLNEPLHVDWRRSALILGDKAVVYADNKISIQGETFSQSTYGSFSRLDDSKSRSGTLAATASLPENDSFIPPHSTIERTLLKLSDTLISLPKGKFNQVQMYSLDGEIVYSVKSATFTREDSPLVFRSYLTFYTEKGKEAKVFPIQQEFYLSQLVQAGQRGNKSEFNPGNRSDIFYTSKATGYAKTMTVIGAGLFIGAAGALADNNTNTNR